jgi:anti-sigma B factor antagonist
VVSRKVGKPHIESGGFGATEDDEKDDERRGCGRVALKVEVEQRGEWAVLRVVGELDLATSPSLRQHVHDAVADGRRLLVLDLSEVLFCDSSGVGVLVAARRLMRSCAGRLRLILPARGAEDGSHVNRVLSALGVRRLFDCYADLDSAADGAATPLSAPAPAARRP